MPEEYQPELFKEFEKKESSLKRFTKKILPKRREHFYYLPLENAITIALFVILGFIISFALGVEKGKRQAKVTYAEARTTVEKKEEIPVPVVEEKPEPKEIKVEPVKIKEIKEKPVTVGKIEKPYTIQLISYKDRKVALAKVSELKKKGIEADIIPKKNWFQVCVGSYANKKDAESDLKKFSKTYDGCFLRYRD